MGEVVALRRRPHDNIVPLLASFSQSSVESSVGITSINLIFPYAEMDLETWMSLTDTPFAFAEKNPRMDLYQCTYELVSALAFLHRENIDGFSTFHHDLKPKNILVFGRQWKIADFGRAKLRSSIHGSETDGADGLGSYDYHPPEYYDDDGSRASRKHGRPFDVWAMGCIMLQVAVLIAFGWESGKVKEFRSARRSLSSTQRRFSKKRDGEDSSFHNSLPVVDEWIHKILEDGSKMLLQFLEITIQMLRGDSMDRLASWEVELDLYETLNPDHSTTQLIEVSKACIPRGKRPSSTLDTGKPLSRAIARHNMVRAICLIEAGHRLELLKEHEELSSLTSARLVNGSENLNKLLRRPTVHAMERYGIQLVASHYDVQPAVTKIPGKPFTAAKKPEDNVDPDHNVRLDIIRKDLYRGDHAAVKFQLRRLPNQLSAWKDSSGKTPLHYAADYCAKQSTITLILEEFPTPRSLILEVDSSGQTPFHVAATKGDFSTIAVLLRYVEEPKLLLTMRDDLGNTPIGLARNFENWKLVDILEDLTV
jgi:serine/threonine protein kinase